MRSSQWPDNEKRVATREEFCQYVRDWPVLTQYEYPPRPFPLLDGLPWPIARRQALMLLEALPWPDYRGMREAISESETHALPLDLERVEAEWRRVRDYLLRVALPPVRRRP